MRARSAGRSGRGSRGTEFEHGSYTRVPTRYSTVGAVQAARPRDADRRDA